MIARQAPNLPNTRERDFTVMWAGQSVSLVGDQIANFAIPTLALLVLHATAAQVGVLRALNLVCFPLLSLLIASALDYRRSRSSLYIADAVRLAAFTALALALLTGHIALWQLFATAILSGAASVLFDVAYQIHLPRLVAHSFLETANARRELSESVSRTVGPALSGFVYNTLGPILGIIANAATFAASMIGLVLVRKKEPPPACDDRPPRTLTALKQGLAYTWRDRVVRTLSMVSAIRNFGTAMTGTLLLVYLYRALNTSPTTAGAILSAGAVASIIGALAAQRLLRTLGTKRALLITSAEGLVWLAVPVSFIAEPAPCLAIIEFLSSLWLPIWNVGVLTTRQHLVPRPLLGRVHASTRTINLSTMPLGALAGGVLADTLTTALGTQIGLGVGLMASGTITAAGMPILARIAGWDSDETPPETNPPTDQPPRRARPA
jgi:Transmembrane secretion effector